MVTDPAKLAVDAAYQVHGFTADYTGPMAGSATSVLVIDSIADHVVALNDAGKPGAVALKPTVNIREVDVGADGSKGATLTLTDTRWADRLDSAWIVESSLRLNAYERQLTLARQS